MKDTAFFLVVLMTAILLLLGEQKQTMALVIRGLSPLQEDKKLLTFS
jgi:hypothetical protein